MQGIFCLAVQGCSVKALPVGLMLLMGSITFTDFVVANKAHLFAGE